MDWEWKNHDTFTSTKKLQQSTNWEEDIISDDVAKSSISASTGKSVSSAEPFIGLKLGKRTYFENNCARSDAGKKPKSSYCQTSRCQVEGCNLDLSSAKEYHRKHRVCETHSKCPKVVVSGLERRFCQQCSRFHSLAEFDEKKRSCRRRLSDHNARRRKPQQETIHFNSTNLSSTFYGGRQQLSFQSRPAMSSAWENSSASTYSIAKMKTKKSEILDGMPNTPTIAFNRPVPSKGEVSDQGGFKESLSPNVDTLRALSLLSNNSWGLFEPTDNLFRLDHPQPMASDNLFMLQHGLQQGLPHDYWQIEQQSIDPDKTSNAQFQEFQLFSRLYSNPMDEILKPL